MGYELQKLTHVHMAMLELCLSGHSNKEIATAMDMTPVAVSYVIRSPLFQDALARRREQHQKKIDSTSADNLAEAKNLLNANAKQAVEVHLELMRQTDDLRVRQTSATEILNRTFGRELAAGQQQGLVVNLGPGALLNLQLALAESDGLRARSVEALVSTPVALGALPSSDGQLGLFDDTPTGQPSADLTDSVSSGK